jgi:general stress protein YciG
MAQDKNQPKTGTRNRGFASMDPAKQREIASKGGKAAHQAGTAHEFTPEEAREAGRKGGQASGGARAARALAIQKQKAAELEQQQKTTAQGLGQRYNSDVEQPVEEDTHSSDDREDDSIDAVAIPHEDRRPEAERRAS